MRKNVQTNRQRLLHKLLVFIAMPGLIAFLYFRGELPEYLAPYGWNAIWIFPAFVVLTGRLVSRIGIATAKIIAKSKKQ